MKDRGSAPPASRYLGTPSFLMRVKKMRRISRDRDLLSNTCLEVVVSKHVILTEHNPTNKRSLAPSTSEISSKASSVCKETSPTLMEHYQGPEEDDEFQMRNGGSGRCRFNSLDPPITQDCLKELDVACYSKHLQLRHDLNFHSSVVFRKNPYGPRGQEGMERVCIFPLCLLRHGNLSSKICLQSTERSKSTLAISELSFLRFYTFQNIC